MPLNPLEASEIEVLEKESIVDKKKNRLKKRILQDLYLRGNRTIAQLTKELHTSVPSVTTLLEELIEEKWIVEIGLAEAQFGRKPILYSMNPYERYVLLLDIALHGAKAAILNLQNQILYEEDLHFLLEDKVEVLEKITSAIHDVLIKSNISSNEIIGVGISMPGLVNSKNGFNHTYRKLNPENQSIASWLSNHFSLPFIIINDTQATIIGENQFGLARGMQNVLSVNMDWGGVGLGIVLNGKVFQGSNGFAGELGHIQVKENGVLCHCGKVGCLDTLTSAASLIRRVKESLSNGKVSKLTQTNVENIDIELVIKVANGGDALAIDLLHDIGKEMGKGLSVAVHLFNPEAIIINGILAKAGKFISNPIEQAINKYCLSDFKNELLIHISDIGESARLLGTQVYVIENVLVA
jgi:N-acetylglucosamine repressor